VLTTSLMDIAQTDGEPLPEAAEVSRDPGTKMAALRSAILDDGVPIDLLEVEPREWSQ
jgi:hypothetical protein